MSSKWHVYSRKFILVISWIAIELSTQQKAKYSIHSNPVKKRATKKKVAEQS